MLGTLLLTAALAAPGAPPPAARAQALVQQKGWDDLYLEFSSVDPGGYSAADRAAIAQALLAGAHALEGDAVMGVSLAERAVVFKETAEALIYAAELDQRIDQNGQAAKLLDRAVALDAKNAAAHLARAKLAVKEGDAQLALAQLDKLPAGYEAAQVKALRTQATAKVTEKKAGEAALQRQQHEVAQSQAPAPAEKPSRGPKVIVQNAAAPAQPADLLQGADLAGLRERAGQHFVFAYGNNDRDWGQRAEYEGQVMAALEEAYEFVGETLHANRTQPVAVVLYTKQEYDFHFGGSSLSRAAGFFSGKIRINGAEEMTPEVRAVIVHEYLHAVLDELMHGGQHCPVWVNEGFATYVENQYRDRNGMPGADDGWRTTLRSMAAGGQLPSLAVLDRSFLELPNPRLGYATAGKAVELIVERWGMESFVQLLRDSANKPYKQLFAERMTPDTSALEDEIRESLAKER